MNLILFAHTSEWNVLFLWVNKSIVSPQTLSLKVKFDPLEKGLIILSPNPVGALILTQRHNRGHASMDSVCWKCKQASICQPAMKSDT